LSDFSDLSEIDDSDADRDYFPSESDNSVAWFSPKQLVTATRLKPNYNATVHTNTNEHVFTDCNATEK
jgi:hypothetical protein